MGDFSAGEFKWHASAAFYRPDRTEIKSPVPIKRPRQLPVNPLRDDMEKSVLEQTEYFKAALFRLVMERAAAFMDSTKQHEKSDEKTRFAVVDLQILLDTQVHAEHTEAFDGDGPAGFIAMGKASSANGAKANPFFGIHIADEWGDSDCSMKARDDLVAATLGCHKGDKKLPDTNEC